MLHCLSVHLFQLQSLVQRFVFEIGFVIFIVVLLFGADKIPDFARNLGKGINNIKHATNEIKQEINNSSDGNDKNADVTKQIKSEIDKVKSEIDSITGTIKRDS